jgi:class 3 adenylate cyclase
MSTASTAPASALPDSFAAATLCEAFQITAAERPGAVALRTPGEHAARLGDDAWDRLLGEHDAAVHAEIDHHHGTVIKMTGDGVLALFESAVDAGRCALAIHARLRGLGLEVRAGIHTGSFLVSGDDLHGLGLHIAARVMASATDGGVRITAETVAALGALEPSTHPIGATTLRGIPGKWDLHELHDRAIH